MQQKLCSSLRSPRAIETECSRVYMVFPGRPNLLWGPLNPRGGEAGVNGCSSIYPGSQKKKPPFSQ
ncbi:hypothetical protein C0Q70_13637 [Pomacea canaliculata]|uniref:Uncharacterized protein n=1 Tax=Pomacea canaliculata TaxID=400727 RepID=A0A2T7NXR6_POMCA|nr:hypothetical protein C0Q70_13637 [Pomacea canaliculata]